MGVVEGERVEVVVVALCVAESAQIFLKVT